MVDHRVACCDCGCDVQDIFANMRHIGVWDLLTIRIDLGLIKEKKSEDLKNKPI